MFLLNRHPDHRQPLTEEDAATLGTAGAVEAERFLAARDNHAETPLHALPALAGELGIGALHVKDEGQRLGLGSFKALGGAYAVMQLVLEEAGRRLGRTVDVADLQRPDVRAIAAGMTFACATDGNHGRSVAQGAGLVGARSVIFVHSGVSNERVAAIARFGAEIVRIAGDYDQSVKEAARVAAERDWTVVSDTSWPGYERIPGLVMQGYTVIVREALKRLAQPPTHIFLQAGVGGFAAAVAGHFAIVLGEDRPRAIVVEPARAACLYETAKAGHPIAIAHSKPTVMAMLECYEPSLVAWRVLSRIGDAFMTVDEDEAVSVMSRLARPSGDDPAIVSGESGGAGLAGLIRAAGDKKLRAALGLDAGSRVLIVNSEGATDPGRYADLVGMAPEEVGRARQPA
ncbi:diaminopropionate ammonia-lyase [Mesorhizobium sp. M4B.F.Ca.ET.215.01.1.1]|uniref:Diaminopropionate ammonia-lyase n=1 Tax=Mesorhizobium abyssinicae TaxID=1209958 RepID=A0ABU5AWP8_9HYPH|nr:MULTISPECIES: diaminopropionate ammonia-lyase [Mesorhizobium]MDX8541755.1 diaminopropionate ammonia-lyase [Mesorhizobium abyssinicae]RUW23790.1 diaminopropionate ammonia-lyase [Mesorhizobium sp. M4B.F.Ca.ET.013.02.1.1]RVD40354.1 diaminopropionate ammonia-lyase [Mesorhizobium sp. M4B.F.Ca.ET.019.03.1.1]RWA60808.1 MAG: diaminopropionate ammonia-lyase [Mesorhizobium sp.]RWF59775.1 MAG: diaminopropionate ammonia-lyase [Mesorhizobium sp.]